MIWSATGLERLGRPFRPVRPATSWQEGNVAKPARTSQTVNTTPRFAVWMSGAYGHARLAAASGQSAASRPRITSSSHSPVTHAA